MNNSFFSERLALRFRPSALPPRYPARSSAPKKASQCATGRRVSLRGLLEKRFHLLGAEGAHGLRFDVTQRGELEHYCGHRLFVWRLGQDRQIILAECPEQLSELNTHLRSDAACVGCALNGVFDIADSLVGVLQQRDIGSHNK